ncbi:MAG TPA: sialidase family protein [Bryobacteraceae bacterium]|nr:sialidase family protein [Bryobacteraceae bacterium]
MFNRAPALVLGFAVALGAQTPLENGGKPMRVVYECSAADTQAAGLGCSEEDPCPVYLELANVDSVGVKLFVTGNLHTPMATLDSILLASDDEGKTWTEPQARVRQSGLDQIQFVDLQHGWISGANLQGAPRDPFFLITDDGGKTWRERPIFEETRVSAIESFSFESSMQGSVAIDATLDNGMHETYETQDGGNTWVVQPGAEKSKPHAASGWRVRADAATRSYLVEKSENSRWQKVASFLVNIATCKQ